MLGFSITTCLLFVAPALPQEAPPSLVLVEGGKTKVGSSVKAIEALITENEAWANTLAGETPLNTVTVADFYLMPNEVTNEQYAEYVAATGAQPPYYWGERALDAGRMAFLEAEGKRVQEARAQGEPVVRKKFIPSDWWDENWREAEWEVPADELTHPVVYIDHANARDYAKWAGLRLMTEEEYQRAARGKTDRTYPWGEDWDDSEFCNSLHLDHDGSLVVGSFPKGAVGGVYDLVGNVWEWTDSPYRHFEGYKPVRVRVGRGGQARNIDALAGFDPNERVVVSGSYTQTKVGVRIATRMGVDRGWRTEAMGFRCAADVTRGKTAAARILADDILLSALPHDITLYPDATVALQRWTQRKGSVDLEGYAVVTSYEHMLFCPVLSVPASSKAELTRKTTADGPMFLGFVAFTHPLAGPELDGGTYLLTWRGAGKLRLPSEEDEPATTNSAVPAPAQDLSTNFWDVAGFDADSDCFFLYSVTGDPLVAFAAGELNFKKMRKGAVALERFVPPTEEELALLAEEGLRPPIPLDTLRFSLAVAGKSKSKGLLFDLPVQVSPGTIDDSWR